MRDDEWPYGQLECEHEGYPTSEQTVFDADEVDDIVVWPVATGAACRWTCPVCGQEHETEVDYAAEADEL